ncbi:hypothetical protein CF327_g6697 [Tilletia walkeri]|nr:hypothetical protein CF327_g6697 [Tilletia walkeri]
MNFESPGALRRRIDAAQYAEESVDELSLGMARRAPSGVDSSMLSLADSSRDVSSVSKSVGLNEFLMSRPASPPSPPPLPSLHRSTAETVKASRSASNENPKPATKAPTPQRRALTPTLAPTQDRQPSSLGSTSDGETESSKSQSLRKSTNVGAQANRGPVSSTTEPATTTTAPSAFSVAARRIRIANGTPPPPQQATAQANASHSSPSFELSTPRATNQNSAIANLSSTPAGPTAAHDSYAASTVSTTSSNDLLTPAAHKLRRGNTSLPGLVGPESVLRPRAGGVNVPTSSRIASGNAAGAHVDVGKLAAYQHKINERLEEENGRLREDAEQLTTQVEDLETEVERKEVELDRALAANEELRKRLEEREQADRRRDTTMDKLEMERRRFESRAEALQKERDSLDEEVAELRDDGSKMLAELEDLNAEMDQKNKDLVEALKSNDTLQKRVELLERDSRRQASDKKSQDQNQNQTVELREELAGQQRAIRRVEREVESLRMDKERLEAQVKSEREARRQASDRDSHQESDTFREELAGQQRAMRRVERELEDLRLDKEQLEAEVDRLQEENQSSRLDRVELDQLKEENDYLQKENSKLMDQAQDMMDQLDEQRAMPPRQERSQSVRFDQTIGQDSPVGARSILRGQLAKSVGNKTFDLSLPNLANLSTMSWLNDTTIGDQGMLSIIQQLQREVDERNGYVDDLLSKLDAYGKLLLQLGEKYELAQRKLATLAFVEQDHDRMVLEREEIMEDVDRLEQDMREVREEAAQIGRELEALRSVKEARRNEESTMDLHVEIIAQLRKHHVEECKALMVRIRYLKAKWMREANFRSDLGYQKGFLQQLVGGLERDLASTQIFIADVNASRGLVTRARTPKNRLKEAMLAVRAVVRMRMLSERWKGVSASKATLGDALVDARARREQRRLNEALAPEGGRPGGRVSV